MSDRPPASNRPLSAESVRTPAYPPTPAWGCATPSGSELAGTHSQPDLRVCHRRRCLIPRGFGQTAPVVSILLSVTFACGVLIAVAHVVNQRFVPPVYDVAANLTAFGCAVAASVLLGHPVPAILSGVAIVCWLVLARRTVIDRRERRAARSLAE